MNLIIAEILVMKSENNAWQDPECEYVFTVVDFLSMKKNQRFMESELESSLEGINQSSLTYGHPIYVLESLISCGNMFHWLIQSGSSF